MQFLARLKGREKRKRTNRENPEIIGENPGKSGKFLKGQKGTTKDKKGRKCTSLFVMVRVKGSFKHVSSVVAATSIAIAPLASFTSSSNLSSSNRTM